MGYLGTIQLGRLTTQTETTVRVTLLNTGAGDAPIRRWCARSTIPVSLGRWASSTRVRPDMLDQIDGYRIYGAVADVLFGLGWILFGASLGTRGRMTEAGRPIPAASPSS